MVEGKGWANYDSGSWYGPSCPSDCAQKSRVGKCWGPANTPTASPQIQRLPGKLAREFPRCPLHPAWTEKLWKDIPRAGGNVTWTSNDFQETLDSVEYRNRYFLLARYLATAHARPDQSIEENLRIGNLDGFRVTRYTPYMLLFEISLFPNLFCQLSSSRNKIP